MARRLARRALQRLGISVSYSHVYSAYGPAGGRTEMAGYRIVQDYAGAGLLTFALVNNSGPVSTCKYIASKRYTDRFPRRLAAGESVLVGLKTTPEHRGRGLTPLLIAESSDAMFAEGAVALHAMIWFSNAASIRAFIKAGWQRTCRHLTIRFKRSHRRIDVIWPPRGPRL